MSNELFNNEELLGMNLESRFADKPVTVLGKTFENDDERRAYFRQELRKKLPELKKLEGYPIAEDILNLCDPPYYTACPNPWFNDFVDQWESEKKQLEVKGKRKAEFEVKEPYASDVSEGKNNPIYNAHSYHTKVPHPTIMRYILHYTQLGDIVLDGFCGTGMIGVVAQLCAKPEPELKAKINYVVWSDVFICPDCGSEIVFWEAAVNKEKGEILEEFPCPNCGALHIKKQVAKAIETVFDKM